MRALSEAQPEDAADFAAQLQDLRRLIEMKKLGLAAAREQADAASAHAHQTLRVANRSCYDTVPQRATKALGA